MTKFYLWTDLETTGSDEKNDRILEVGMVLTDKQMERIGSGSWVINDRNAADILATADPVVQEMHAVNGLADEIEGGIGLLDAENEMLSMLQQLGEKGDFILAGSGVAHFDRRFLTAQMPRFVQWLKYYSIDVGVMRRVLELCSRDDLLLPKADKAHRALADAEYHLAEFMFIKQSLSPEAVSA